MIRPFNGWVAGLPFYSPVILIGIFLLLMGGNWGPAYYIGGPILLLGIAMMLFFRDFPRAITAAPHEVVSPADGTVVAIEDLDQSPHYDGPSRRVSIFLSVFSVHVNRTPYPGTVTDIRYMIGKYKDARDPESSKVNESNAVWFQTDAGPMTVRQISGAIARRIVCPVENGATLQKGEKFGMIRFGSRTELYLPPGTEVTVALKDKVNAGTTIIAKVNS